MKMIFKHNFNYIFITHNIEQMKMDSIEEFSHSTGASVIHKVHLMRNPPDEQQKQFDRLSSLMFPKNIARFCCYDYARLQMLTLLSS